MEAGGPRSAGAAWPRALLLLSDLAGRGLAPNAVTCGALLSACKDRPIIIILIMIMMIVIIMIMIKATITHLTL